jgi:hypothetical protein
MEIDSGIPLPSFMAIVCTRGNQSVEESIRKFVADCGTKIVVTLTVRGKIKRMETEFDCMYGPNCSKCQSRMEKIRELIDNGR